MPHLVYSNDTPPTTDQRILRMLSDIIVISALTGAEIKPYYTEIERMRDRLSSLLDRADGKF